MKLKEMIEKLGLKNLTPQIKLDEAIDITGGYASDLLSDVLANAPSGGVLVTILVHMNVVAVSVHANLGAVIFASGLVPDEAVIQKAVEEEIPLFSTQEPTFDVVGRLYDLGLRGPHA